MEIVEVFKTNVETSEQARHLVDLIQDQFPACKVNFDLDDCDRILRVKSTGFVPENSLIEILRLQGFDAAILTDEIPPFIGDKLAMSAL